MNVLILEDHPIIRSSLINLLNEIYKDLNIFETSNIHECEQVLNTCKTLDFAFLDIYLKNNECGLNIICKIKNLFPNAKIIVFSLFESADILWLLKKYKVNAFFPKSSELEEIKDYLININIYISNFYTPQSYCIDFLNNPYIEYFINNLSNLTPLEHDILKLKIQRYKNKDIAHILQLKLKTVENYINRISDKLVNKNTKFNDFIEKYHNILSIVINQKL